MKSQQMLTEYRIKEHIVLGVRRLHAVQLFMVDITLSYNEGVASASVQNGEWITTFDESEVKKLLISAFGEADIEVKPEGIKFVFDDGGEKPGDLGVGLIAYIEYEGIPRLITVKPVRARAEG
jgi:hypothetical protein